LYCILKKAGKKSQPKKVGQKKRRLKKVGRKMRQKKAAKNAAIKVGKKFIPELVLLLS